MNAPQSPHLPSALPIPQADPDFAGTWSNRGHRTEQWSHSALTWIGRHLFGEREDALQAYANPAVVHIDEPGIHAHAVRNIETEFARDLFLKRILIQLVVGLAALNLAFFLASATLTSGVEHFVRWRTERTAETQRVAIEAASKAAQAKLDAAQQRAQTAQAELQAAMKRNVEAMQ